MSRSAQAPHIGTPTCAGGFRLDASELGRKTICMYHFWRVHRPQQRVSTQDMDGGLLESTNVTGFSASNSIVFVRFEE